MKNISTEIGKIYSKYNESSDTFNSIRVLGVDKNDNTVKYIVSDLDEDLKFIGDEKRLTKDEYNDLKKEYSLLKSDGIVSITNIVAVENEVRQVKDIVGLFFPNNRITGYPDAHQPFVIARQAINNIFDISGSTVGMSVSLDTLPAGYAISDFMENASVISSVLSHVYKVDTCNNIARLLENDETTEILKDLYDHEVQYRRNTVPTFEEEFNKDPDKFKCLNGYNIDLEEFIRNSDFMNDILHTIGIISVDFALEADIPLTDDDKLLLSTLYGGIKIDKAIPLKFGYDIDLKVIKMKYFLIKDINETLWIVPYTSSSNEIDDTGLYNLTEERTYQLQQRLRNCVKAYSQK